MGSWSERTPPGTGRTATIGGLDEDTEYAVQVRALNGETDSDWSMSGKGRTGGDDIPAELPVITVHALAQSVEFGGIAYFELRRTGATTGDLRYAREGDIDGHLWVSSWGRFVGTRTTALAAIAADRVGTAEVRILPPIAPYCGAPDEHRNCTDDYEVGSPSSASMRVVPVEERTDRE